MLFELKTLRLIDGATMTRRQVAAGGGVEPSRAPLDPRFAAVKDSARDGRSDERQSS